MSAGKVNQYAIIYLVYNFFTIMSESDSIDGLYCGRYDVNYFNQSHLEGEKSGNLKQTGLIEEVFAQLNMSYSLKYGEDEEIQKQVSISNNPINQQAVSPFVRPKKIISVGQKFRAGYMRTKKGNNEETNDLSINVCTLIKSFCDQYQTFEPMQEGDAQLINQFKKGKPNMEALRRLMSNSQKISQLEMGQFQNCKEISNNPLRQYFTTKLQDSQVLVDLLKSRKMKFSNKIVLIKYLEAIRKSTKFPQDFKGWKGNRF